MCIIQDGEVVIGTPGPFNWRGGITKNLVREVLTEETKWYWSPVEDIVPIIHEEPDPVPSGYYTYAGYYDKQQFKLFYCWTLCFFSRFK